MHAKSTEGQHDSQINPDRIIFRIHRRGLIATGGAQAASVASKADVDGGVRDAAFTAVEDMGGLEAAMAHMGDPANGMLDLAGAGLHTFAVTRNHIIIFDHSGQTDSGMDLSEFLMPDGRPITTWLVDWAQTGPTGGGGG